MIAACPGYLPVCFLSFYKINGFCRLYKRQEDARLIRVFSACQVINMKCQDLFSLENKNKRNIWNAVLYSPKDYGKKNQNGVCCDFAERFMG